MIIKCIGCYELRRRELNMSNGVEIVYECERYFPYMTTIGGLLRPASGTLEAVKDCPEDPLSHCVVCSNTEIWQFRGDITSICKEHATAWGKWLDAHPERRAHLAPKGRVKRANWVEVFREFVEDIRKQREQ